MNRSVLKKLLLTVPVIAAIGGAAYYVGFGMVPDRVDRLFNRYGFAHVEIEDTSFHGDSYALGPVTLDEDGFSQVRSVRVQPRWRGLFGGRFIDGLIIDDMSLQGEWQGGTFGVAGWRPTFPPFPQQDNIILNGVRIDLDTPYGMIRTEAKGRINRQRDGSYKTEAMIYGRQHQLTFDTSWTGSFDKNGQYAFEGEIREANIRTDRLELSRGSGWLQVASQDGTLIPALAGQIIMGRLSWNGVPFSNASVTFEGPMDAQHVIITAEVPGMEGMRVSADLTTKDKVRTVDATVRTTTLKDMLAFLVMLRQRLEEHEDESLTGFLLTPGNIERLRREIAGLEYDELTLHITGPDTALHGSIIAEKKLENRTERRAISLDPATRRAN